MTPGSDTPERDESEFQHIEMPPSTLGSEAETGEEGDPIFKTRRSFVDHPDFSLSPKTLVGSFVHRMDANDGVIWEGRVVGHMAEGQGENVYLLELTQSLEGQGRIPIQVLVRFASMLHKDDGYEYRFYDNEEAMRGAFAEATASLSKSNERTS
jgi:hypothetical protein